MRDGQRAVAVLRARVVAQPQPDAARVLHLLDEGDERAPRQRADHLQAAPDDACSAGATREPAL